MAFRDFSVADGWDLRLQRARVGEVAGISGLRVVPDVFLGVRLAQ